MTRQFSVLTFALGLLVAPALAADAALTKAVVLENNVAYLRVGTVDGGLAAEVQAAQKSLAATNQIIGTVLDLRFAGGDDLATTDAVTNFFAGRKLPLAILVNGDTHGAAAALAATLRQAHDGLVLGGATAGLQPDLTVVVKATEEKKFLDDPYAGPALSETNSAATNGNLATFIDHTTEADLVREKIKDGEQDEDSALARPAAPPKPYIHDPVLARAVDLLKALAVVRPARA